MKNTYRAIALLVFCCMLVLTLAAGTFAHAAVAACSSEVAGSCSNLSAITTATATWTRTTTWSIDKSVTPDFLNLSSGGSGTVTYQIELANKGTTDAASISGCVYITNAASTVSDSDDGAPTVNLTITIRLVEETPSNGVIIAPFALSTAPEPVVPGNGIQSVCYPYTITIPPTDVVNGAVYGVGVLVDAQNNDTSSGGSFGPFSTDVTLNSAPTPVHASVNVADTFNNFSAGPFTTDQPSLTYQRALTCAAGSTVTNTAIVFDAATNAELDSASANVSLICPSTPPAPTPTMVPTTTPTTPGLPNTGSDPNA